MSVVDIPKYSSRSGSSAASATSWLVMVDLVKSGRIGGIGYSKIRDVRWLSDDPGVASRWPGQGQTKHRDTFQRRPRSRQQATPSRSQQRLLPAEIGLA